MAFIAAEPPSIRPRGNTTSRPSSAGCGVPSLPSRPPCGRASRRPPGSARAACASRGLASISSTETSGFSVRREARTQPAVPPPTITTSCRAEDRSSRSRRSRVPHVTRWCLASVHGDGDEALEGHDGDAVGSRGARRGSEEVPQRVGGKRFAWCGFSGAGRRTAHPVRLHDRRVRETRSRHHAGARPRATAGGARARARSPGGAWALGAHGVRVAAASLAGADMLMPPQRRRERRAGALRPPSPGAGRPHARDAA